MWIRRRIVQNGILLFLFILILSFVNPVAAEATTLARNLGDSGLGRVMPNTRLGPITRPTPMPIGIGGIPGQPPISPFYPTYPGIYNSPWWQIKSPYMPYPSYPGGGWCGTGSIAI